MNNEEIYIDRPVADLFKDIGRPYKDYEFISEPPGEMSGCIFIYDDNQHLIIYLTNELNYLESYREDMNWDVELFKKERIGSIRIDKIPSSNQLQ